MIVGLENSADGLIGRFMLRDGLLFRDRAPVMADDVVVTLRR